MATVGVPEKVDERPSLYIRDDYARELPSDLDVGDSMNFTVTAEVTGISKNKYEDGEEHLSYDLKINTMKTDGIDEREVISSETGTPDKVVKSIFDGNSAIVITFKKE
jgi:hypothetical protein